jgi:carboxyl-terminal processing protease
LRCFLIEQKQKKEKLMTKTITTLVLFSTALLSTTFAQADQAPGDTGCIGAQVQLAQDGNILILSDLPNTPALAAGLQAGDEIEAVQVSPDTAFIPVKGMALNDAVDLIRGPVGTPVSLEILRGQQEMTFSMLREVISQN